MSCGITNLCVCVMVFLYVAGDGGGDGDSDGAWCGPLASIHNHRSLVISMLFFISKLCF